MNNSGCPQERIFSAMATALIQHRATHIAAPGTRLRPSRSNETAPVESPPAVSWRRIQRLHHGL